MYTVNRAHSIFQKREEFCVFFEVDGKRYVGGRLIHVFGIEGVVYNSFENFVKCPSSVNEAEIVA